MSSEKNDTKIIWFGSVVLILQPFLETQSFTNLLNLRVLFTTGIAVHKFSLCLVCTDQWAFRQQCMEVRKAIIPDKNEEKIDNDYVLRNDHRIKKTAQPISMILVSFFSEDNILSDETKMCYILNIKVKKIEHSTFLGTPGIGSESPPKKKKKKKNTTTTQICSSISHNLLKNVLLLLSLINMKHCWGVWKRHQLIVTWNYRLWCLYAVIESITIIQFLTENEVFLTSSGRVRLKIWKMEESLVIF